MSTPAGPPAPPAPATPAVRGSDLLPLLTAAVRAVLVLLVPLVLLTLLGWLAAVRSTSSLAAVVRVGADVWLLGHGADVAVVGATVGVAPLGVTLLAALSARRAVRMWVRDQAAVERDVPFWPAAGVFSGGYGVLAALVALVTRSGVTAASPPQALLGGALVAFAGFAVATWAHRPPLTGLPAVLVRALHPALLAVGGLLALGALAVAAALVAGRDDVLLLHDALHPGWFGGLLLVLGQALLLPTLAVWALAWIAGPGFAVGVGTSVAPGGTSLATLPTVPVLGALPAQGPGPVLAWAAVLLPVLLGAAGLLLERRRESWPRELLPQVLTALAAGALAGLAAGLLAAFAAGPAGPGRMSELGPAPLLVAGVVAGEVAAGGVVAVLLARAWRSLRGERTVVALPDTTAAQRSRRLLGRDRPDAGGRTPDA